MPVMAHIIKRVTNTRYFYQMYPMSDSIDNINDVGGNTIESPAEHDNFKLIGYDNSGSGNWIGRSEAENLPLDFNATINATSNVYRYVSGKQSSYPTTKGTGGALELKTTGHWIEGNRRGWAPMANVMSFTSTNMDDFNTKLIEDFNLKWFTRSGDDPNDEYSFTVNQTITVFNYRLLTGTLESQAEQIRRNGINSYVEGGLSTIFEGMDAAAKNPNDYFTNGDNRQEMVNYFNAVYEKLNSRLPSSIYYGYIDLRDALDAALAIDPAELTADNYTQESIDYFNQVLGHAREFMADVWDNGYNMEVAGATGTLYTISDILSKVLNPMVDVSALQDVINVHESEGIFNEDGEQIRTLSSWIKIHDQIQIARSLIQEYTIMPNYTELRDESYFTLDAIKSASGGQAQKTDVKVTNPASESNQRFVEAKVNEINSLALDNIDASDPYDTFDAAVKVFKAMDRAKFTADALATFDTLVAQYDTGRRPLEAAVYITVDQETADFYNNHGFAGKQLQVGEKLKATTTDETDKLTAHMIESYNSMSTDSGNYNKFNIYGKYEGMTLNDTTSYNYGDSVTLTLPSNLISADSTVTWRVDCYNQGEAYEVITANGNGDVPQPYSTQILSSLYGATVKFNAVSDMIVTAIVSKNADTGYTYKILDAYGSVVNVLSGDTIYTAEYVATGLSLADAIIPFYTFSGWDVSAPDKNNVIIVKPSFTAGDADYKTVSVTGGSVSGSFSKPNTDGSAYLLMNRPAKVTSTSDNFYAWAVNNNGKYQIVSYDSIYKFNVVADEIYTVVEKRADGKYYADEIELTPQNIDGFDNNTEYLTDEQLLTYKLDNKLAFIYLYNNSSTADTNGKIRVYARVTTGGTDPIAFGLRVRNANFASTAANSAGQFYMLMSENLYSEFNGAFVTYSFSYSGSGVDTLVNTSDIYTQN